MSSEEWMPQLNRNARDRVRKHHNQVREIRRRENRVRVLVSDGRVNAAILEGLIHDLETQWLAKGALRSIAGTMSVVELEDYLKSPGLSREQVKIFLVSMLNDRRRIERELAVTGKDGDLMSGADCEACNAGQPVVAAPIGAKGHPSGCCLNCHALACDHHGLRDGGVPEYRCVQCDPSLLSASAVVQAQAHPGAGQGITEELADVAAGYFRYRTEQFAENRRWVVPTVEQFMERRPGYGEEFFREFYRVEPKPLSVEVPSEQSLARSLQALPPESAELLQLALFICLRFELVGRGADPVLRRAMESLTWGARDEQAD